jgi:hypothetical protein
MSIDFAFRRVRGPDGTEIIPPDAFLLRKALWVGHPNTRQEGIPDGADPGYAGAEKQP